MLKKPTLQELQHLLQWQHVRHAASSATKSPISQKVRFIDQLRVSVRGGQGGGGSSALFGRTGHHPRAAGGNGAPGGSVVLRASKHLTGLGTIPLHIEAEKGGNGGKQWMDGRKGADRVVPVPLGTLVYQLVEMVGKEGRPVPHGVTALLQPAAAFMVTAAAQRPGKTLVAAGQHQQQQQQQQPGAGTAAVVQHPAIRDKARHPHASWPAGPTAPSEAADSQEVQQYNVMHQEQEEEPNQKPMEGQHSDSKLLHRSRHLFTDSQLQAAQQHRQGSAIQQYQQLSDQVSSGIALSEQGAGDSSIDAQQEATEDLCDNLYEKLVSCQWVLTQSDKLHLLNTGSLLNSPSNDDAAVGFVTKPGRGAPQAGSDGVNSCWASSARLLTGASQSLEEDVCDDSSEDDDSGQLDQDVWEAADDGQSTRHLSKQQVWSILESQALLLGELDHDGQELVVAVGGSGGRGNAAAASQRSTPASRCRSTGNPGQEVLLLLKLRLLADVVLVGLPNVGKSSLIAALTNARAQIGSYPFTTLRPQLGAITDSKHPQPTSTKGQLNEDSQQGHGNTSAAAGNSSPWNAAAEAAAAAVGTDSNSSRSTRLVLADLPGLVPGAHAGKGRGTSFLAHVQKARCLAVVVDMTGTKSSEQLQNRQTHEDHANHEGGAEDFWRALVPYTAQQQLAIIQEELTRYDARVLTMPMLVVANKMDALGAAAGAEALQQLKATTSLPIVPVSAKQGVGLQRLKDALQLLVAEG